jgi:hypothetical protein
MTRTIDRMLVTPSVFFDPLIPGFAVEGAVHALHLTLNTAFSKLLLRQKTRRHRDTKIFKDVLCPFRK